MPAAPAPYTAYLRAASELDVARERIKHEQPTKQFLPHDARPDRPAQHRIAKRHAAEIVPGIPEAETDSAQRHDARIEPTQPRQHAAEQQQHDRHDQAKLTAKQRQRHRERVVERACDERSKIHGLFSLMVLCATAGAPGASCTRRVQSARVSTWRLTVGVT